MSNGVDELENFTSEMEWSFLFPSVSPAFFQIDTVTCQHRLRFRWRGFMYEFLPLIRKSSNALRINGGCHATLDGNEGWNDIFSCIGIVSFYIIAKIFCEYKKWCLKIIINTI
ncbi:hypothetical protein [Ligilactobacillus ruminis]|uniref:hypothetical protein n=1 Tax=Ligilactobacillus ruminis TaxID=1623 RepID=UPI003D02ED1B